MFRKLFKRKHLSDSVTDKSNDKSNDKSLCNDNEMNDNEINVKSKPIIYFSTDKGKYVCVNVPNNVNVISNIEFNSEANYKGCKNIYTKSYPQHNSQHNSQYNSQYNPQYNPQHNRYDNRYDAKDDYKYMDEIYDSYISIDEIYDSYMDEIYDDTYSYISINDTVSNIDKVENNTANPSTNLDYISKNFLFDEHNRIYYFKRNDSCYNESLSYNDSSSSNL